MCPTTEAGGSSEESYLSIQGAGHDQLDNEVIGSQYHQPSGSNLPGGLPVSGQTTVTTSTWWGFQCICKTAQRI